MTETAAAAPLANGGDPMVEQFRTHMQHAVETQTTGPEIVDSAVIAFTAYHQAQEDRIAALMRDVRGIAAEEQNRAYMLAHTARTVGRQVEVSAHQAAALERHRTVEHTVADLASNLADEHPELAQQLREALHMPVPPPQPVRSVVVAFAPDTRWRVGWFLQAGADGPRALPFAGWVLAAAVGAAVGQQPEAAFLLSGRMVSLTDLQRMDMMLQGVE